MKASISVENSFTKWFIWSLLGFLLISLLWNLGLPAFFNEEPRRSLIAWEMLQNGNLLVPTEIGELYYKKPPMYNWLIEASWQVFGVTEFASRLVTVLFLILNGWIIYWWVKKYYREDAALIASLLYMVSADLLFAFSMLAEIDIFFSCVTFAFFALIYHCYQKGNWYQLFLWAYGLSAIGVLTKGLPSLVFLACTGGIFLLYKKELKRVFSLAHLSGILLFGAIVGVYIWGYAAYNDPMNYINDLWSQSSDRTVLHKGFGPLIGHLFGFPLDTLKNILPASLFLPFILHKPSRQALLKNDFLKYCGIIFLANVWVYWISPGSRARYVYMLYPLLIILLTHLYINGKEALPQYLKGLRIFVIVAFAILIPALVAMNFVPEVSVFSHVLIWSLIGAVFVAAVLYLNIKFPKRTALWLVALMITARLLFDALVLPIRAQTGEHTQYKIDAERVAAITKGENLYLKEFLGDGTYSLGSAFYLDRARNDVLRINREHNCKDFFIVYDWMVKDADDYQLYYEYTWRLNKFYLVKFTGCEGGQP